MYAITINHPECDFFPFLMDLTVAEIFYFLEVYKLKKAEKTSDWCNKLQHRESSERCTLYIAYTLDTSV